MLLSHLLSPGDLGAALVLMAILMGCEVVADIGLDKFVMVSRPDIRAQAVAVTRQISVARGIVLAAAIILFAPLLAAAFGASSYHRVVSWLGLVSFVESLRNWRIIQIQREYNYGPETIMTISSRIVAIVAIIPAYFIFHDEKIILVSLLAEACTATVLSYVLAPPERVAAVDPVIRREAIRFGLPLMVNGLGIVAIRQLDQVIVANLFSLSALAGYTLAINLAILPTSLFQSVGGRMCQPLLARSAPDAHKLAQASLIVMVATLVSAALLAVPTGLVLDRLVPILYGSQYHVSTTFAGLAMLAAFTRFSRGGPNLVLLQHGRTGQLTIGNLITGIGLLIGFLLALVLRSPDYVVGGLVIGDLLSFFLLSGFLMKYLNIATLLRHGAVLSGAVVFAAAVLWINGGAGWEPRALAMVASMLVVGFDIFVVYRGIFLPFTGRRARQPMRERAKERQPEPHAG